MPYAGHQRLAVVEGGDGQQINLAVLAMYDRDSAAKLWEAEMQLQQYLQEEAAEAGLEYCGQLIVQHGATFVEDLRHREREGVEQSLMVQSDIARLEQENRITSQMLPLLHKKKELEQQAAGLRAHAAAFQQGQAPSTNNRSLVPRGFWFCFSPLCV
jgi:hypothetical protein